MLLRIELYFIILFYFSLGQSHAGENQEQETLTTSFKASVTGSSGTTECEFSLQFTDVEILKSSKVKCGKIKKTMIKRQAVLRSWVCGRHATIGFLASGEIIRRRQNVWRLKISFTLHPPSSRNRPWQHVYVTSIWAQRPDEIMTIFVLSE